MHHSFFQYVPSEYMVPSIGTPQADPAGSSVLSPVVVAGASVGAMLAGGVGAMLGPLLASGGGAMLVSG